MIGALNHRCGDRVSNRDQCSAGTMHRALTTSSFLRPREDPRQLGRVAAPQILTEPTKQAGAPGPKAQQHL
jgi:hypothetical protein